MVSSFDSEMDYYEEFDYFRTYFYSIIDQLFPTYLKEIDIFSLETFKHYLNDPKRFKLVLN